jgi:DNA-binding winged helix-turn-helix (wHTH) protein
VQTLLNEASPATAWHWGDYLLLPAQRRLLRNGEPVEIEDRAFDLIVLLLQHRERALDRQEVISAIWGPRPVSDATLRQLVYKARRAIGDDGEHQNAICTLYGRSVQWVAPVEMVFETGAQPGAEPERKVPDSGPAVPAEAPVEKPRRKWRLPIAAISLLLVLAAGGGYAWWHTRARAATAASVPRLAIEPIENATGDSSLDWIRNGLPGLLGSLLEQEGEDLGVVDYAQVARAWKFNPTHGRTREQQLRFATGADVLVSGRLRKLTDKLYELVLRIQPADGDAIEVRVDGERPGVLAAIAVSRIRRGLGLAHQSQVSGKLPGDPFLAEAFARGVDLSAQGKYVDAQSYFAICVKGAPAYLPARLQLGDAQMSANDLKAGEQTLTETVSLAEKQNDPRDASRALFDLGLLEMNRGQADPALRHMQQSVLYARRSGDVEFEIGAHLVAAVAANQLNKPDLADRELGSGKQLLAQHPNFRKAQGVMYDVESIIAAAKGDHPAMMTAVRASLELNQSLGNERNTVSSMNNLATGLDFSGRPMDSLAVAAPAYSRATQHRYRELEFQSAETLDDDLWKTGLEEQAIAAGNALLDLARQENSKPWQALVLHHLAHARLAQSDGAGALAVVRKADALIAPEASGADLYLDGRMLEARAAFSAEPSALAGIRDRFDAYIASHNNADSRNWIESGLRRQMLVQALAHAAAGQPAMALSALRKVASRKLPEGLDDSEFREVALMIAIATGDKATADVALSGLDVAGTQDGVLLMLCRQWALKQRDVAAANRADTRLAELSKTGREALAGAGLDPDHPDRWFPATTAAGAN